MMCFLFSHQRLHVAEMKSGAEELKEYASAMSATNTAKNRDLSRLPCEWVGLGCGGVVQGCGGVGLTSYFLFAVDLNRVRLGDNGDVYINASPIKVHAGHCPVQGGGGTTPPPPPGLQP